MVADASGPLSYPASRGSSNTLTDAELRYANIERELLYVAIVYCCEWFQTNFWDQSFHKSLEAIQLNHLIAPPPPPPHHQCSYFSNYMMLPLSTGWARTCGLLMHHQGYGLMSKIHCMSSMYRYVKCVLLMKKKKVWHFFMFIMQKQTY